MTRGLLDVNVLLALLDPQHVDHAQAHRWLDDGMESGWASCAITQNGFVRIMSQPQYTNPVPTSAAAERLARATAGEHHEYWPCDVSLLDGAVVDRTRLHRPRQITDAYLLALAVAHDGRLVTFDRGVSLSAVHGAATHHLAVL